MKQKLACKVNKFTEGDFQKVEVSAYTMMSFSWKAIQRGECISIKWKDLTGCLHIMKLYVEHEENNRGMPWNRITKTFSTSVAFLTFFLDMFRLSAILWKQSVIQEIHVRQEQRDKLTRTCWYVIKWRNMSFVIPGICMFTYT